MTEFMSDADADDIEVFTISEERIMTVLHSEQELDGIAFDDDVDGALVVYCDGMWGLNLFLLALAWTMGPDVEPKRESYQQIYKTLAMLTMGIGPPSPAPEHGPEALMVKLPAIRINSTRNDR
ncbi:hypothetical protein [Nocardia brasiliensis]|uniref:hypothetical protein n=1 Tax=Nocardia brasiliensis TaxID=37326 RepID=UPI00366DB27E